MAAEGVVTLRLVQSTEQEPAQGDFAVVEYHQNGSVTIVHWTGGWTTFNPSREALDVLAPGDLRRVRAHCRLNPVTFKRALNDTLRCALTRVEMYAIEQERSK